MSGNNRSFGERKMPSPARDMQAQICWQGYDDVRNGRGFCADYDGWNEKWQRAYELGRSYAMACKLSTGTVTYWKRNAKLRAPNEMALTIMKQEFQYHRTGNRKTL